MFHNTDMKSHVPLDFRKIKVDHLNIFRLPYGNRDEKLYTKKITHKHFLFTYKHLCRLRIFKENIEVQIYLIPSIEEQHYAVVKVFDCGSMGPWFD